MDKLVNMKLPKREVEASTSADAPVDRPVYPWGLSLTLDESALEKLGITELPDVGGTLMLVARVDVTSVSENEHLGDKGTHQHRSVSLQITDMCLEAEGGEKKSAAAVLFGG